MQCCRLAFVLKRCANNDCTMAMCRSSGHVKTRDAASPVCKVMPCTLKISQAAYTAAARSCGRQVVSIDSARITQSSLQLPAKRSLPRIRLWLLLRLPPRRPAPVRPRRSVAPLVRIPRVKVAFKERCR
jgi:hypothetical protein